MGLEADLARLGRDKVSAERRAEVAMAKVGEMEVEVGRLEADAERAARRHQQELREAEEQAMSALESTRGSRADLSASFAAAVEDRDRLLSGTTTELTKVRAVAPQSAVVGKRSLI